MIENKLLQHSNIVGFSKTMSRWGIACCGRSLRLRLRLLQLQSHLDSSTKTPDQTKPQETIRTEPIAGLRLHVFEFPDFSTFRLFLPPSPLVSCRVPAPQLACLVVSEVSLEVRLARWHANRHGAQNLEFLEFHKFWWLFHEVFQILMHFSKPFLFKQMWWELFKRFAMKHQTHGFSTNLFCARLPFFFFLLCFQEGTVKGECCEALCGAPKHHCDMSRSKHWSSARLSGKPA